MRNRISYQNVGLLVGPSPAFSFHSGQNAEDTSDGVGSSQKFVSSELKQLNLVQNASFNFSVPRSEIGQVGGTSLVARKAVSQPDISLGFTYILADGKNEDMLGFNNEGQTSHFLSGQQNSSGDRNVFLIVSDHQQEDFNLQKSYKDHSVLSFGNCFPVSYSVEASVGSVATASVEYLASNAKFDTASGTMSFTDSIGDVGVIGSGLIPAIDPTNGQPASTPEYGYILRSGDIMTATDDEKNMGHRNTGDIHYLRPGDMELSFAESNIGGLKLSGSNRMHITDISIEVPIERTDLYGFGSKYVYDRRAMFPAVGNISFSAIANNFNNGMTDDIFAEDQEYDFTITFMDPTSPVNSDGKPSNKAVELEVTKAICQTQSFSIGMGGNMSVQGSFAFECSHRAGFKFSGVAGDYDSVWD